MGHPPPGGAAAPNPANADGARKGPPMWFVNKIQLGSEKMCEKGIYGRVTIDVFTGQPQAGGKRWISISDIHIRYSTKNGEYWAALPSRSYQQGGETKYANVVYLFPEQRELYDKWQKQVIADYVAECSRQGVELGCPGPRNSGDGHGGQSAPATSRPAQAPPSNAPPAAAAPPVGPPAATPPAVSAPPAVAAPAAESVPESSADEDIPF